MDKLRLCGCLPAYSLSRLTARIQVYDSQKITGDFERVPRSGGAWRRTMCREE